MMVTHLRSSEQVSSEPMSEGVADLSVGIRESASVIFTNFVSLTGRGCVQ